MYVNVDSTNNYHNNCSIKFSYQIRLLFIKLLKSNKINKLKFKMKKLNILTKINESWWNCRNFWGKVKHCTVNMNLTYFIVFRLHKHFTLLNLFTVYVRIRVFSTKRLQFFLLSLELKILWKSCVINFNCMQIFLKKETLKYFLKPLRNWEKFIYFLFRFAQ